MHFWSLPLSEHNWHKSICNVHAFHTLMTVRFLSLFFFFLTSLGSTWKILLNARGHLLLCVQKNADRCKDIYLISLTFKWLACTCMYNENQIKRHNFFFNSLDRFNITCQLVLPVLFQKPFMDTRTCVWFFCNESCKTKNTRPVNLLM